MAESQGTLTNGDLTTSEAYIVLELSDDKKRGENVTDALIRYYNDLNSDATVKLYGTTTDDATWDSTNNEWDLSGASRWETLENLGTVAAGTIDYSTLHDDWEFLRVGVTPATDPTSGDFEVVSVQRYHE